MRAEIALVGIMASGCGGLIFEQAQRTASVDHGCPAERIGLLRDASMGTDYAYWLNVCGQQRFYHYRETSTAGVGSGRFMDETAQMGNR